MKPSEKIRAFAEKADKNVNGEYTGYILKGVLDWIDEQAESQEPKVSHANPNCLDPTRCSPHGEDGPVSYQEPKALEEKCRCGGGSGNQLDTDLLCRRCHLPKPQEEPKNMELGISKGFFPGNLYEVDVTDVPEKETEPKEDVAARYNELIMAVENKYPRETRHQTALRYIQKAQEPTWEAQSDIKSQE